MCTKMNNSTDDRILGHVVDIVYEIAMPVIVKSEKLNNDDNDNLVLIGVMPAIPMSAVPVNITVKKEKIDFQKSENTNTQSQFFGNKVCESKEGDSKNKEHDDDDLEQEQELDVVNSSQDLIPSAQGPKRLVDTEESKKTGKPKKRKKTPVVVGTE